VFPGILDIIPINFRLQSLTVGSRFLNRITVGGLTISLLVSLKKKKTQKNREESAIAIGICTNSAPISVLCPGTHSPHSAGSILQAAAPSCNWWGMPCSSAGTSAWHTEPAPVGTHTSCRGPAPMTRHPT
jgi:hypothetical protein